MKRRYSIEYTDGVPVAFRGTVTVMAYDMEHALERFYGADDDGFEAVRIARCETDDGEPIPSRRRRWYDCAGWGSGW